MRPERTADGRVRGHPVMPSKEIAAATNPSQPARPAENGTVTTDATAHTVIATCGRRSQVCEQARDGEQGHDG